MHALQAVFQAIASWVFRLGGIGLLLVGVIDSSILMAPLANDFLVVALSATNHDRMPYYAVMAAIGSTLGSLTTDVIGRKAKEGVAAKVPSKRLKFVERQFRKRAGWTVVLAAIIPPPFPFTPFVALAAGLDYPRKKLLTLVAIARFARFVGEGALAIVYGDRILSIAKSPVVKYTIIGVIVLAVGGSAFSIVTWVRKSRGSSGGEKGGLERGRSRAVRGNSSRRSGCV